MKTTCLYTFSLALLMVGLNGSVNSFAQDGNNLSERYQEIFNSNNFSRDYRENYRENLRLRNSRERYRVFRSTETDTIRSNHDGLALDQMSSVMRSPKPSSGSSARSGSSRGGQTSNGSSRNSSGGGGGSFHPMLLSPPSLLQSYLSGQFSISAGTREEDVSSLEVETEQPEEIKILSPSELLFEEGVQYFRQSRYREAMNHFRSLLDLNPDDASKAVAYGLCHLAVKEYETAAQIMADTSTLFADEDELYLLIQSIYGNEKGFFLHYKQLESKRQQSPNDEIEYLAALLHSVKERF